MDALLTHAAGRAGVQLEYRSLRVTPWNGIQLHGATLDGGGYRLETELTRMNGSPLALLRGRLPVDTVELSGAEITALDGARTVGSVDTLRLRLRLPAAALRSFDPTGVELLELTAGHVELDLRGLPARGHGATEAAERRSPAAAHAEQPAAKDLLRRLLPRSGPVHSLPQLLERLPLHVRIASARLRTSGETALEFTLDFEHRSAAQQFGIRSAGRLLKEQANAGTWSVDQRVHYRSGEVSGVGRIDALDLEAVGKLLGGAWHDRIGGGTLDLMLDARLADEVTDLSAGEASPATGAIAATIDGEVRLTSAVFTLPAVAGEPIVLPDIGYRFHAQVDASAAVPAPRLYRPLPVEARPVTLGSVSRGAVIFDRGRLRFGRVEMDLRPSLRGLRGLESVPERVELLLELPPTRLREIADSLPTALLGPVAAIDIDGSVAWKLDFESPTESISRMQWRSEITTDGLELRSIPAELNVFGLRGTFIHRIVDEAHGVDRVIRAPQARPVTSRWLTENAGLTAEEITHLRQRTPVLSTASPGEHEARHAAGYAGAYAGVTAWSAPRAHRFAAGTPDPSYRYVPLASISPWVVRAILTAEDRDFFRHRGVNWTAVRRAVERNVASGEIVVGASTITMQLAKNLFLSNDRLLARKLQEYILVLLIEEAAAIPKERLLEIYLNVIEFGPGVYGIYDAARHYFARHPGELTAAEAAWLASIVPSPRRLHAQFEAGEISDVWFERMVHLMRVMHVRGKMTEEQFLVASGDKPRFAAAPQSSPERSQQVRSATRSANGR